MSSKKREDNFLAYYVVAFFDLLGQQERLRELRVLPNRDDPDDMKRAGIILRDTYGAVTAMRQHFTGFFNSFSRKPTVPLGLTKEQRKKYDQLTHNPIKFQRFSDSIIVYSCLKTDKVKLTAGGIFGILCAAAATFLVCLAEGHPIRGGIDVGPGIEIRGKEIYGPALSRAYTLESQIANYPRIVVGDDLVRYLQMVRDQTETDEFTEASKDMARRCIEWIVCDEDGYWFIDYLGAYSREMFGGNIDPRVLQMTYKKVDELSILYQKMKNGKLAFRYSLLRNYMGERRAFWKGFFENE